MSRKIDHNQSKSLWNYTLSPGWKESEVTVLKMALMKFGVGKWKKIVKSNCLPGKSVGQIYMQTQRLLGQQSLGEFMGINVDADKVFGVNKKKKNVLRKNNFIVNNNDNLTKEEKKVLVEKNKIMFGVGAEQISKIVLPRYRK